jgi:hypothetical protein
MSPVIRLLPSLLFALALVGCGDSSTNSTPTPVATNGFTLISPNGGETFQVGSTIRFKWSIASHPEFSSASPFVTCGNDDWYKLIPNGSVAHSSADTLLTIPDTVYSPLQKKNIPFPAGTNCKAKIADYVVSSNYDTSDESFTIKAK